ncbi:hypothetical protein CYY_002624 [Polysphondylium violaceum]|uniref:Uncharacterized protein n=1 Tax=Polysphondylium violaceum TaxID=133409 RepID=A0A8J4PYH8_9MYCE|nr:hypothetical protein CYY_002624 [Polysphondylium violaceum]
MENQIRKNPFLSKMIHHHQVINSQEKEAAKIAKKAVTIGVGGNHSIFQRFKTATRLSTKNELPGVEQVDSIFLDSFEIFYNVGYNKIENNGSKYESLQTIKESSSNDSTTKKYYIQGILHLPNIPKLDKKLIYTPIHNFKLHYNKDKKIWNPIVEIDGGKWVTILNPVPEYHPYYEQFDLMIQMGKQISKYLKEYPDPEDFDREVLFQKLRSNIDNFQEDILYAYLKEIFDIVKAQSSKVKESNIQILMTLLQCNSMEIFETNKSDVPMPDIPALTKPKPNQPTPTPTPTPLSTPPLTQTIQTPENVTQEKKKIKKKKTF